MFEGLIEDIQAFHDAMQEEVEIFEEIHAQRTDESPDGIMVQTVQDVLYEPWFQGLAIKMIADKQMRYQNKNMYGQLLPKYAPDTIRKKAKLGFPANELVRYTNYWTGTMRNYCIKIKVDTSNNSYDFKLFDYPNQEIPLSDMADDERASFQAPNGFKAYSTFVPADRIDLMDENLEIFEDLVMEEVTKRLDEWEAEKLREQGINPQRFGFRY